MHTPVPSERAAEVHDVLSVILDSAASAESLSALLQLVYDQLGRVMDTSNFYVALYDPDSELYSFPFSMDQEDDDFTPQELRNSLTDYVRRTGEPLLCDSARHRELIEDGHVAYVGGYSPIWLGVPLRTRSGNIGVAVVQSYTDPGRFTDPDRRLMATVCNGVSAAIEQSWARESRAAARRLEVRELEESRDEALRASAAKSSFLANMSHELRTPLNAIIGYSELLLDDLHAEGRAHGKAELGNIRTAAHHLLTIINDILDLSRIEEGKERVLIEDFTLASFTESIRGLAQPLADGAGVSLSMVAFADHDMHTDRQKLLQVVMNLVSNACRFAAGRSVTIRIDTPTILDDQVGWTRIEVADTGDGIDPAELERLFEPFEQADRTTTRVHGGTGLGLAISRKYCRLLGGDLTAASVPGRGSAFKVMVPAVYSPDEPALG